MDDSIKKKIELVLVDKGMSMAELGRKLGGMSGQRIGQYLAGTRKAKKEFYDAWEEAFGYRLESNVGVGVKKNDSKYSIEQYELLSRLCETQEEYIKSLKEDVSSLRADLKYLRAFASDPKKIQSQ